MHREDNSNYLLYIEPSTPKQEYIDDNLTKFMKNVFSDGIYGSANYDDLDDNGESYTQGGGWRGSHRCECGKGGGCHDYLLFNGMIVNALCVHYIAEHRNSIPKSQFNKLKNVAIYYRDHKEELPQWLERKKKSQQWMNKK